MRRLNSLTGDNPPLTRSAASPKWEMFSHLREVRVTQLANLVWRWLARSRSAADERFGEAVLRVAFKRMMLDASKCKFDAVFWAIGRISREGIEATLSYIRQLDGYKVVFSSYHEPFFDTSGIARGGPRCSKTKLSSLLIGFCRSDKCFCLIWVSASLIGDRLEAVPHAL